MTEQLNSITGTGRWLIVGNAEIGPYSARNPNKDVDDSEHLSLDSFEEKPIDESWLNVPWFVRDHLAGRITLRRSDDLPPAEFKSSVVVDRLVGRGMLRHAAVTVWNICAQEPIPPVLDQYIELEPSHLSKTKYGQTALTARWDLKTDHLPFLRQVLELEQAWRKRPKLIRRLKKRIKEIEDLRV